jgi:predicted NAD/FAD-binding protein
LRLYAPALPRLKLTLYEETDRLPGRAAALPVTTVSIGGALPAEQVTYLAPSFSDILLLIRRIGDGLLARPPLWAAVTQRF